MIEHVLVLLHQLLRSEVAILVKEIDFKNLFAVWGIGIGKEESDKEGENVSEGSVTKIGAENVVVIGVEELDRMYGTKREAMPPA